MKEKTVQPLAVRVDEAALMAGMGRSSMFKAIRERKLKARKVGHRTLILVSDLRAWLEGLDETMPATHN